jgi:GNAT superfamily N-acetyltransferase
MKDAGKEQMEQAIAENHKQLFMLSAAARGGEVIEDEGLCYTHTPGSSASVLFPALTTENASLLLDKMMAYYRQHPSTNIGYWSLESRQPADIGPRLLARGFQDGWHPCWMALDLDQLQDDFPLPEGVEIHIDNNIRVDDVKGLPYGDSDMMTESFFEKFPGRAQRLVALLEGKVVGHTNVFFTTGDNGVAGLYNVGVLPDLQRKGIGKALVAATCRYAKERGYQYATLNANHIGRRTYELVGFTIVGYGITWWIVNHHFIDNPPSPDLVKLAEAIGVGDLATLEKMGKQFTAVELNKPITNGMTLLQLAAHCKQPATADWLVKRGVACTPLDAWDLGWKERAAAMLAADPAEVNHLYYDWDGTLLHIAAMRGDLELAQLAMTYHPDLTITDKEHDSTAMGWALYFRRAEIVMLIQNS